MQVIDADAHVEESVHTWQYVASSFDTRRPAPVTVTLDTNWGTFNGFWIIDDKMRHCGGNPTSAEAAKNKNKEGITIPSQELTDPAARLADLDRLGIEKQVIYPTLWLICLAEDADLEVALARSYNEFMSKQCSQSGGRLWYAAIIPFRRPQAAVEEIRRVKRMGGAVSILIRGIEWDKPLNHPSFFPIYEEAERRNLAIAVHLGMGSPSITRMLEGIPRITEPHFSWVPARALSLNTNLLVQCEFSCLMEGGLLINTFPKLRWVFLEAGSEWTVSAVKALSHSAKQDFRRYFAEWRIFIGCEPYEDLPYLTKYLGEDCLVVGSDFPHEDDFRHDRLEQALRNRGDLSERFIEKILSENPAKLYGGIQD